MQDFRNLQVWKKAHELALLTYRLTSEFPKEEIFGLRNSMRKTSVDIPAYIAEGCGKSNDADFAKALGVSLAFANRLEYYALMAHDLKMINETNHTALQNEIVEVKKMINGFSRKLVTSHH
jgi:four helix bundle protein